MKQRLEIIIESENNSGRISILHNGKEIPNLYGFDIAYDSRANATRMKGKRLATDDSGQFFVDEKGETATEEIDLMRYLSDFGIIHERVQTMQKEVGWALTNLRATSIFNAKKMIERRLS